MVALIAHPSLSLDQKEVGGLLRWIISCSAWAKRREEYLLNKHYNFFSQNKIVNMTCVYRSPVHDFPALACFHVPAFKQFLYT
jgi:hypothetical protein